MRSCDAITLLLLSFGLNNLSKNGFTTNKNKYVDFGVIKTSLYILKCNDRLLHDAVIYFHLLSSALMPVCVQYLGKQYIKWMSFPHKNQQLIVFILSAAAKQFSLNNKQYLLRSLMYPNM